MPRTRSRSRSRSVSRSRRSITDSVGGNKRCKKVERSKKFEATITYAIHATKAARGYEKEIGKGIEALFKSSDADDKTAVVDLFSSVYLDPAHDNSFLTDDINSFKGLIDVIVVKAKDKKLIVRIGFSVAIKATAEKIADELLTNAHLEIAYGTLVPVSAVVDLEKGII